MQDHQVVHDARASSESLLIQERELHVPGRESCLIKRTDGKRSQYLLDGHDLFGAYSTVKKKLKPRNERYVASGCQSDVYKRNNPHAPVLVKVGKTSLNNASDTRRFDRIALMLATTPDRNMAAHFAIEVHKGIDNEGNFVFLTRKVNGMTLGKYFDKEKCASRFPVDRLGQMLDELDLAVAWLNRQGYLHRDIKQDNVMIDLDAGKLVLIDFGIAIENPDRLPAGESAKLRKYVEDQIQSLGSKYREAYAARDPDESRPGTPQEEWSNEGADMPLHVASEDEQESHEPEGFFRDDSSHDDMMVED